MNLTATSQSYLNPHPPKHLLSEDLVFRYHSLIQWDPWLTVKRLRSLH